MIRVGRGEPFKKNGVLNEEICAQSLAHGVRVGEKDQRIKGKKYPSQVSK